MAQIESWLWNRLSDDEDLTEAIGDKGVWPVYAPQSKAEPFVTFTRSNTRRDYTTRKNDGVPTATFEVNCWDDRYERLMVWSDVVRQLLDGYRGEENGFTIQSCFIEDEADVLSPPDDGSERWIFGRQFVVLITHTEEVPTHTGA